MTVYSGEQPVIEEHTTEWTTNIGKHVHREVYRRDTIFWNAVIKSPGKKALYATGAAILAGFAGGLAGEMAELLPYLPEAVGDTVAFFSSQEGVSELVADRLDAIIATGSAVGGFVSVWRRQ